MTGTRTQSGGCSTARRAVSAFLCLVLIAASTVNIVAHSAHAHDDHEHCFDGQTIPVEMKIDRDSHEIHSIFCSAIHYSSDHESVIESGSLDGDAPDDGVVQSEFHAHAGLTMIASEVSHEILRPRCAMHFAASDTLKAPLYDGAHFRPPITFL